MVTPLGITYVYWKFLGLCPFVFAERESEAIRVSCGGLIYAIILAVVYTLFYLRAVTNRTTFTLPRESPMSIIADFSGLSVEFGLVVTSWICFGLRQREVGRILEFFKKIHETHEHLGMHEKNSRLFREVKIHTLAVNIIWYFLCLADHLLLLNCEVFNLAIWLPFNLPRVVSHNIVVMFADTMRAIEQRFSLLNERIQALPNEVATTRRTKIIEHVSYVHQFKRLVTPGQLETYGQMHSDLIDLAKIVIEFYSLCILFVMLTHFIQMSSGLYTMCLFAKERSVWSWTDVGSFLVLSSWLFVHFAEIIVLVSVSDSTMKEANRTGNLLHRMLLARRADRYIGSAKILSVRLLQRRLSVDLFGLLQMRLSIIHRIVGTVATYITMMVQLDSQDQSMK